MSNGSNNWDVPYSHIDWFSRLLSGHANVIHASREQDILFRVSRKKQGDVITALCLQEYVMGVTMVLRAIDEFPGINIIYIGAGWCGYTMDAKRYCIESQIGLYVSNEMAGALWRDEYWSYCKKDDKGNPMYFNKAS